MPTGVVRVLFIFLLIYFFINGSGSGGRNLFTMDVMADDSQGGGNLGYEKSKNKKLEVEGRKKKKKREKKKIFYFFLYWVDNYRKL